MLAPRAEAAERPAARARRPPEVLPNLVAFRELAVSRRPHAFKISRSHPVLLGAETVRRLRGVLADDLVHLHRARPAPRHGAYIEERGQKVALELSRRLHMHAGIRAVARRVCETAPHDATFIERCVFIEMVARPSGGKANSGGAAHSGGKAHSGAKAHSESAPTAPPSEARGVRRVRPLDLQGAAAALFRWRPSEAQLDDLLFYCDVRYLRGDGSVALDDLDRGLARAERETQTAEAARAEAERVAAPRAVHMNGGHSHEYLESMSAYAGLIGAHKPSTIAKLA
ncbi:hypothetical protein M885DRAFT_612191 [Pelagophyceae sp. CCMP2097]|nr:hypothetical protein M885DRAFT_612191 [Pelagophyceae sp. CCMP2097]